MTLIPCNGPDIAFSKKSELSRCNDNLAFVHYSELFLLQAALQTLLCGWLVRIGRDTGQAAAWVLLVPQACLVYDNLIVGLGSTIGPGACSRRFLGRGSGPTGCSALGRSQAAA
jgi:hypothetical protein